MNSVNCYLLAMSCNFPINPLQIQIICSDSIHVTIFKHFSKYPSSVTEIHAIAIPRVPPYLNQLQKAETLGQRRFSMSIFELDILKLDETCQTRAVII